MIVLHALLSKSRVEGILSWLSTFSFRSVMLALVLGYSLSVTPSRAQELLPCDLNGDDRCTPADVNTLATSIAVGADEADLNEDSEVNTADLEYFLANAVNRLNGDFDFFNGGVTFSSFLRLSDSFGKEGLWTDGDMTADGRVDFADFLLLSSTFGDTNPGLSASVSVEITELNGFYTYEYTVTNDSDAIARINTLFIDVANGRGVVDGTPLGPNASLLDAPRGWVGDYIADADPVEEVSFLQNDGAFCGSMGIPAGGSETFVIESEYAPDVRTAFAATLVSTCDHFFAGASFEVLAPSLPPAAGESLSGVASVPEPSTWSSSWMLAGVYLVYHLRIKRSRKMEEHRCSEAQ